MKKRNRLRCVVCLSVESEPKNQEKREEKQLRYIREYAKANGIEIIKILCRSGLGAFEANRQFEFIIKDIEDKKCDGILVAKMEAVSKTITDAYTKIGRIIAAGGHVITVDEGDLRLPLKIKNKA